MGRPPRVTRTLTKTTARVLAMDLLTQKPVELEVTLPRAYKEGEDKRLFRDVCTVVDDDQHKAVSIQQVRAEQHLYGMTEAEFLKHAMELPPRKTSTTKEKENEHV